MQKTGEGIFISLTCFLTYQAKPESPFLIFFKKLFQALNCPVDTVLYCSDWTLLPLCDFNICQLLKIMQYQPLLLFFRQFVDCLFSFSVWSLRNTISSMLSGFFIALIFKVFSHTSDCSICLSTTLRYTRSLNSKESNVSYSTLLISSLCKSPCPSLNET